VDNLCAARASLVQNLPPKIFLARDHVQIDDEPATDAAFVISFA
jgi:hypothetical protein